MAVYTLKVKARKRPVVTKTHRRLRGLPRQKCRAAKKYLEVLLRSDTATIAKNPNTAATRLVLMGDLVAMGKVAEVIEFLDEALTDSVTVKKS